MNREAIAAALFTRVSGSGAFAVTQRRVRDWTAVSPSECPALFFGLGGSRTINTLGQFPMWSLEFVAYLYVYEDSNNGPSSQLNELIDGIVIALQRDENDPAGAGVATNTTLGGLVYSADVKDVQTDEGTFGERGVALVTIEVLAAG